MGRSMRSKETYTVSEDTPPTNNGIPEEQTPTRQDVDVLLDVPELEVDRISLTVRASGRTSPSWRSSPDW
jgi:hypothetical protein